MREEGKTNRQIGEKLGFSKEQIKQFINRYNKKQMKIKAGMSLKRKAAKRKEKITAELQLHSDQGFQYTSQAYFNLTKSYGITPSMSRRGNPYDNAMAENFFSILKTECVYRTKLRTYDEARLLIGQYIDFYNNERIQLKTKLTPIEFRSQYVA